MRARQLQQPSARFGNTSGLHVSQRTWPQYSQTFALDLSCWQTEHCSPLFIAVSLFKEDGQFTDRIKKCRYIQMLKRDLLIRDQLFSLCFRDYYQSGKQLLLEEADNVRTRIRILL